MEGFGDVLGSIGELFGELGEANERIREALGERSRQDAGAPATGPGNDRTATVDRVLCGGRETPNINDR